MGDYAPATVRSESDAFLPLYSWLAKQFTYCDYHFGLGTNSTPGHMLAVGGQTPTLRNPPSGTSPVWDLPTIFKHVEAGGHTWGAFTGSDLYPLKFYKELADAASRQNIHTSTQPSHDKLPPMAAAGTPPDLCFPWGPPGDYGHAPDPSANPQYATQGHNLSWQGVDAVVKAGGWADTVFILTWDDWGGYADHVSTPDAETVVDALHPSGFQLSGGTRIPMLMFGGRVRQGIDTSWHSHAVIPKTVIDLLGLAPFGIPRVDTSASLAGRVDATLAPPGPPSLRSNNLPP